MSHEVESMAFAHETKVASVKKKKDAKAAPTTAKVKVTVGKGKNKKQVDTTVHTESAYDTPWHGLGERVSNELTPQQMLKKAGLDWTVDKVKTKVDLGLGKDQMLDSGRTVLVRSTLPKGSKDHKDRILTHLSEDWNPVQNDEAFNFFNEFVLSGKMEMNTAGSLNNGKMVWALAKLNEKFELFGGKDVVEGYLLFSNPHEYAKKIDIRFTPIRVVCHNTLTLALDVDADHAFRVSHKKKFDPELAKKALKLSHDRMDNYKQAAELLSKKKFTADTMIEFYLAAFPTLSKRNSREKTKLSRPAEIAKEHLTTQPGAEFGPGTFWALFNSATYVMDHKLNKSQDSRLTSAWYGSNRNRKIAALDKAIELAKAA